jgi:hypothetical protein
MWKPETTSELRSYIGSLNRLGGFLTYQAKKTYHLTYSLKTKVKGPLT